MVYVEIQLAVVCVEIPLVVIVYVEMQLVIQHVTSMPSSGRFVFRNLLSFFERIQGSCMAASVAEGPVRTHQH